MASPGVLPSFEFNATYIHSLRRGDPSTEEHFVSHFSPMLLRKLRKHLRSSDLAHDLRQETFLRVLTFLRSEHSIREPKHFEYFVLGVCNNVLHESYRQQKNVVSLDPEIEMASHEPGPDICAMAAETADHLQKMLSALSPSARAILKAVFLEEKDRDEICVKFGVDRDHLRLLICRAKKALTLCAQKEMSGKSGLHLPRRCASRPKRKTVVRVITSRAAAPKNAISHPATLFLPHLHATHILPSAETWVGQA